MEIVATVRKNAEYVVIFVLCKTNDTHGGGVRRLAAGAAGGGEGAGGKGGYGGWVDPSPSSGVSLAVERNVEGVTGSDPDGGGSGGEAARGGGRGARGG